MARGVPSSWHAALLGVLCALLAVGPALSAPGEAGSGSGKKPPAPGEADLIDDLTIDAPTLTPPPTVKAEHLQALDPKAAAKAKADEARPDSKDSKADEQSAAAAAPGKGKKVPTADAPWLEKSKALLELTSKTEGATVFFDGKELGKTPLEPTKVLPGAHELKLTKEGMADSTRTLRLKPGGKLKVSVDLRPPAALAAGSPPAPLHVDVIDDDSKPEDDSLAPPLITASGDLAGPGLTVAPPLKPAPAAALSTEPAPQSKALVRQWWFWGAVAAGAVVLATGVVYALPPQYAEKRDPVTACGGAACGVVINK